MFRCTLCGEVYDEQYRSINRPEICIECEDLDKELGEVD